MVLVGGHPREAVSVPDHPIAMVTEVFELESIPVEVLTRVVVLEIALEVLQLEVLEGSSNQLLAGGIVPSALSVAGTIPGLANRALQDATIVDSPGIFGGSALCSCRAERHQLYRLRHIA